MKTTDPENVVNWSTGAGKNGRRKKAFKGFLPSATFLASMKPPDYAIDGLLMCGSTYTLTGRTGHAKTLLALLMAIRTASNGWFCGRQCRKGSVAFFAGENPDNVRIQFFSQCRHLDIDGASLPIVWHDGACSLEQEIDRIKAAFAAMPDLSLCIVDSLQAFFEGDNDNDNMQMLDTAIMLRQLTEGHPGRPATVILCHPIKNAARENLLPRGGSSTLNEVDGNLTAWLEDDSQAVTLDWAGKFRGAPFEPVKLETLVIRPAGLVNARDEQMPCTVIQPMGEMREAEIEKQAGKREQNILEAMQADRSVSQNALAAKLGLSRGIIQRTVAKLKEQKWIRRTMGKWVLTKAGEEALKMAREEA